jgi:hypothetical protein
MYKDNILPSDQTWTPFTGSITNREIERFYGSSRCWPNCVESHRWIVEQMAKLLKENPNYKPEWFSEEEIDRIKKKLLVYENLNR